MEVAGDPRPLLLLRPQRRRPCAAPLGLEPVHHPQEGELEPLGLLGLGDAVDRRRQHRAGAAEVDLLHLLDQVLDRRETATLGDQAGGERDREDRQGDEGDGAQRGLRGRIGQA